MSMPGENKEENGLQQVFIRAVTAEGEERELELSCIKRMDEFKGRMRLLFNDGKDRHFYFVPGLSYAQAREKIAAVPGVKLLDLGKN